MNYAYVVGKCLQLGMTIAGAIGCAVNIAHESGGRSDNVEDTFNNLLNITDAEYVRQVDAGLRDFLAKGQGGFGLCQWTALDRRKNLYDYMKGYGRSIADEQYQYLFMAKEMRERFPHVWFVLTHTDDPYEAAYVMCKEFEIPANTEATSRLRGEEARKKYPELSGTAPAVDNGSAEPAQKSEYWPPRMIDKGMDGPDVLLAQASLLCQGYTIGDTLGIFGASTEEAVKKLQKAHGKSVDGVIGHGETWPLLRW